MEEAKDAIMWYVICVKQMMKIVWVEIVDQGEWEIDISNLYNLGKCDIFLQKLGIFGPKVVHFYDNYFWETYNQIS